jgi:hypothetical protein
MKEAQTIADLIGLERIAHLYLDEYKFSHHK